MIRFLWLFLIFVFFSVQVTLLAQTTVEKSTNEKQAEHSIEEVGKKISEMPQERIKCSASNKNSTSLQAQKKTSTVDPVKKL